MARPKDEDAIGFRRPEVIVDFECEKGFLYLVIANVGSSSAKKISIKLDKKVRDFRGKPLSEILRHLEFLPPGKRFRLPVDRFSSYVVKQPMQVSASITYTDMDGRTCSDTIMHNLAIYKDLAEL